MFIIPPQHPLRKHPILLKEYINGNITENTVNICLKSNLYILQYINISNILPRIPPMYEYPLLILDILS